LHARSNRDLIGSRDGYRRACRDRGGRRIESAKLLARLTRIVDDVGPLHLALQNYTLRLSGAIVRVAITVRLLKSKPEGVLSRAF
jgi:hypothetical protein